MKPYLLTTLLLVVLPCFVFAENVAGHINGKIVDQETSDPLEYVSVAIFTKHDQELITGTITALDGTFSIKGIDKGKY